jgi:hypothetical protein
MGMGINRKLLCNYGAAIALAFALFAATDEANAACVVDNGSASCTGSTVNQNFPFGFSSPGNINIEVGDALVQGDVAGMSIHNDRVTTGGLIQGGNFGITSSDIALVTVAPTGGINARNNNGVAVFAPQLIDVENAGSIIACGGSDFTCAGGGIAISSGQIVSGNNFGKIAGDHAGIVGDLLVVLTNSGTISERMEPRSRASVSALRIPELSRGARSAPEFKALATRKSPIPE